MSQTPITQAEPIAFELTNSHLPAHPPEDFVLVATLDVAGQDEAATDPLARLKNPARDYTVAHIFQIQLPDSPTLSPNDTHLPIYHAIDLFIDHGSRHFLDVPGRPALVARLLAWLKAWKVTHLVADCSGVGQGVVDWLVAALGPEMVTGFDFAGSGKKAWLGSAFLSMIETGRFRYWAGDENAVFSDGWWFWQQVCHCTYQVPPHGRLDRDMQWSVPEKVRISTPRGRLPVHDDRLLSAALVAVFDGLIAGGKLHLGTAKSAIIPPIDLLDELSF